jgi:glycosyltransferase involved in cell wall biosynthesis
LINEFENRCQIQKVTFSKKKVHLIWFIPYCFLKSLLTIRINNVGAVHLCDALLSPVGFLLKILTKVKVSTSVHGLDITFPNRVYQAIIPWCVSKLHLVICVSRATRDECLNRGIPGDKCEVIPNGIIPNLFQDAKTSIDERHKIGRIIGTDLQDCKLIVSVGRLVKRKGVEWFVANVIPRLPKAYKYLVVGDGPEYKSIVDEIERLNLERRVFVLRSISDSLRNLIYYNSDILVMPNIILNDDVEGFGIVAIEGGCCGLPVVASNIQGIRDAVLDGRTGYLVGEKGVEEFVEKILFMDLKTEEIKELVKNNFSWSHIYERYESVFKKYIK